MSHYEYKVVASPNTIFEYRVVPAPTKGIKRAELKTPQERFSHAIQDSLNKLAAEGWEYVRAELLPSEERQGLASTHTVYRSVLVFRRLITVSTDSHQPAVDTGVHAALKPHTDTVPPATVPPATESSATEPTEPAETIPTKAPAEAPSASESSLTSTLDDVVYKPKSEAAKGPLTARPKNDRDASDAPPVFLRAERDTSKR